jgi:Ca-activated chloride channel family protein
LLLAVLLIVVSALVAPRAAPADQGLARIAQVDASAYPEITLYLSATDESGAPRTDLGRDDFVITEDGQPVTIADFGAAGAGSVTTALVIDRSGSMDEDDKIDGAREAAAAFVELMGPGDRAALLAFNDEVRVDQRFTENADELLDAIDDLDAEDGTALYDGVMAGVELLRDEPGRRLLVVLSDGQDSRESDDPREHPSGSEHTLEEAIAAAEAAGQPVAVIGLGERGNDGDEGIDEEVLRQIAAETGGSYFYAPRADELAALYTGLAADVQREYRLTYVSPRPFYDGTRRDIAVSVGGEQAAGGYTERHLINVVSSPLVGVVLLVPLAGLLAVPAVLRRRSARAVPAPMVGSYQPQGAQPVLMTAAGPHSPPTLPAIPVSAEARRCSSCGAPLRATARFCSGCGASQGGRS